MYLTWWQIICLTAVAYGVGQYFMLRRLTKEVILKSLELDNIIDEAVKETKQKNASFEAIWKLRQFSESLTSNIFDFYRVYGFFEKAVKEKTKNKK